MKIDRLGAGNPAWKGKDVGYQALHDWVRRHKPIPTKCEGCSKRRKLDAANISGKYKRDLSDWKYLCRQCHIHGDGRLKNLMRHPRGRRPTGLVRKQWRGGCTKEMRANAKLCNSPSI